MYSQVFQTWLVLSFKPCHHQPTASHYWPPYSVSSLLLKSVILFWVSLTLWKCRSKVSVIHPSFHLINPDKVNDALLESSITYTFAPCHIIVFMWCLLKLWCHPRQSLLGVSCASYEQLILGTPGLTADPYLQFGSQNHFQGQQEERCGGRIRQCCNPLISKCSLFSVSETHRAPVQCCNRRREVTGAFYSYLE